MLVANKHEHQPQEVMSQGFLTKRREHGFVKQISVLIERLLWKDGWVFWSTQSFSWGQPCYRIMQLAVLVLGTVFCSNNYRHLQFGINSKMFLSYILQERFRFYIIPCAHGASEHPIWIMEIQIVERLTYYHYSDNKSPTQIPLQFGT